MNIKGLLRSRKFLTLVLDVVVSTILYFAGKYAVPNVASDINFLIASYQPVVLAVIATWAYEDVHKSTQ